MWLLENEDDALDGKRLWLRPGKRYLFGRTVAEPGQLAIKGEGAERVSRKHVTIQVDRVTEGDGERVLNRSSVTVEDLGSKGGTWVNDEKIKGEKRLLSQQINVLQMGSFPSKFRITWFPVVLSFSFTSTQLLADPLSKLRENLEQLDVKFLADYDVNSTTHVVSKRRNVPKGLQALVNGGYLVTEEFYSTIITAATSEHADDGVATSPLENDFDANWPDALRFVPPPGDEAVPRPVEAFAPNPDRAEIFHGYTFIFYNTKQYDHLLGPITNGRGKALLKEAVEGQTQIDDFIAYVKGIAGEKGLGEFEDGSEGKGVVVVRWIPTSPENADWYTHFYTSVSVRLDHRLIDQKEFLDAILNNDASGLRRPLEAEAEPRSVQAEIHRLTEREATEIGQNEPPAPTQRPPLPRRLRGAVKSRFKGFAVDLVDDDDLPVPSPAALAPSTAIEESSQEGLFVSQEAALEQPEEPIRVGQQLQRKRRTPPPPESRNMMDDLAPTAAQFKRRRIAAGEDMIPQRSTILAPSTTASQEERAVTLKAKKEIDILDLARQHREEAEARAKAEREDLTMALGDLDLAEIRRLHIEEPIEVRLIPPTRTREQDIADGRWDPVWNGRKNFKKFLQRGAPQGRPAQRIIVGLEEVKTKGFGIGDDYWLEDDSQQRKKKKQQSQTQTQRLPAEIIHPIDSSADEDHDLDDEENNDDVVVAPASRARAGRLAQQTTDSTSQKTQSSRAGKRPAPAPAKEQPVKRPRVGFVPASDDESDDGLRFRFGKR
ncbi:hypothetical protein GGR54DRAFT_610768 [Hypoxylon sp. NC1633]|nr:hypothetical protein GGR54DRAFT_610768 [Hypoxylon sp. NC1633]